MQTVFLSSTSKDLAQAREAAFRAIEGLHGYHCVRMEDFGSWDEAPDDFCRAKVAESDLFICIVGPLYGSRTPAGPSYTEREFDAAVTNKKPCLVFLTAEDFPLAANLIEKDEDRQNQAVFRDKATKGRIITRFSTPDQVSVKVVQAIRNWEASRPAGNVPSQASLLASQIKSVSYRVAVLNQSTRVTDDEIKTAVAALQTQIHRDFAPVWGIDAELTLTTKGAGPEEGSWWLQILDEAEYPGVIAYHSLTPEGLPLVKVSVANAQQYDVPWTTAASHDLMEMLANPRANLTVYDSEDGVTGRLYVREVCDPVAYTYYSIDGTLVSNFVYPAWFDSFRARGSTQFDHEGKLNAPFEVAPGSYVTSCEVKDSSGWRQSFAQPATAAPPAKRNAKASSAKAKKKPKR
jgi:hypothetical protein